MSWTIQELALSNIQPKFWLAKRNKEIVCRLKELDNRARFDYEFVQSSELTGTLPYYIERNHKLIKNPHLDKFKEKMLIKMEIMNTELWFTIETTTKSANDGLSLSFTAYSLDYALHAKKLYEIELETATIEDNFEKVLERSTWRLTHVDTPLSEKKRSFNFSTGTTVLNALYEMAETYGGILQFDPVNREIAIYHEDTICQFEDFMINSKNYIKSLEDNRDGQSIVSRMTAIGEDNMMFNTVSPSGQSFADDLSYFMEGYEEDENGNVISSSLFMSDGLCHNLLRLKKARDEVQPFMEAKFKELKMYQTELVPLQNQVSDAKLKYETVDMQLDVLRQSHEYYYQHVQDTTLKEEVRAGYYVMQARTVKTYSGKISVSHTYGSFSIDVSANWKVVRMDLFEDYNFDPDHNKEVLDITIEGDVEYMMVRVHKKDYTKENNPFVDKDGNWVVNGVVQASIPMTAKMSLSAPTTVPKISTLASTSYALTTITQPYLKVAMQSYIDKVKTEIAKYSNPIVIPLITDTHYTENSLRSEGHKVAHARGLEYAKLQIEMNNYINADAFVHTGDIVDGRALLPQTVEEMNRIVDAYGNINAPKFLVRGNHDTNYLHYGRTGDNKTATAYDPTHFMPNSQGKEILGKYWSKDGIRTHTSNFDGVYGYKDITSKNLRIIMLDSYDLDESLDSSGQRIYSPRDYCGYRQRQLNWLVETLQNTPNSYQVIVFSHVSPTKGLSPKSNEFNTNAINKILKAFQRKSTVNYTFNHKHYSATINATFTGLAGRLIATVAGHEHDDKYERDSLIDTNVPNFVRKCATPAYQDKNLRGMGDADETAFDTMIIDKDTKTIKFLRFGLGSDFSTTYGISEEVPDSGEDETGTDIDETPQEERPTSNTILNRWEDESLSDEELILKYNVMYHKDQLDYYQGLVAYKEADIERVNEELKVLKDKTDEIHFLTKEQMLEKDELIFEEYFIDETHIDEKEMYDDTLKKLEEYRKPTINMTVDIHNFMRNEEHKRNWNKLKLGKKVRVKHGDLDVYAEAILTKISFDFESEEITLTISGTKDINDPNKKLINYIYDFATATNSLNLKKHIYDDAATKANQASEYMNNKLNAALQRIHAGVNESVEISNRGIVIKSIDYPMDVIMMNSGVIGLSKDGGQTLRTAITADGIYAPEIVGKIMITNKAWIEDDDGVVIINGDKITISTPNPDPEERVVLGQYEKGKYGLKIHNGALEIVGGLLPEHIETAMGETGYYVTLNSLDGYDFAFTDSKKTLVCRIFDGNRKDITDEISPYAFKWEKIYTESKIYDTAWASSKYGKGSKIEIGINEADCIIRCEVRGIRLNTLNASNIYFGTVEQSFTKNEYNGFKRDENIRGDLNLEAPLPTSIKMNNSGITAYTNTSSAHFARLDYRGLYIQNGALDIRTGTSLTRGVVLNGNGLKGYRSDGTMSFSLDTNGGLTIHGGYISIINGLKEKDLDPAMANKWNSMEGNAKTYTDSKAEEAKDYADGKANMLSNNINAKDTQIRTDLRLASALPTNLLLNGDGIKAYVTSDPNRFARLDHRGLYIQGGAIDIRTNGTSTSRGINLDSLGLRGYNASGTQTFDLKSSDGSLTLNGGYLKIINGLKADQIEPTAVSKWDNAETNAKAYADIKYSAANTALINSDTKIRQDLRLTSPLPNTILMNGDGITAKTSADSNKFARLDYRGLYIQGGAIDIRTNGSANNRGINLDSNGLRAYNNSGDLVFNLNSINGSAMFSGEVYVGNADEYTRVVTNYVENYGSYIKTWGLTGNTLTTVNTLYNKEKNGQYLSTSDKNTLNQYRQKVRLRVNKGNIEMRRVTSSTATTGEALFYTDYGISTWENGSGSNSASGTIEFFSKKWNTTSGLTLYSSGNIGLSTTSSSTGGATIYLDSGTSSVIIGGGDAKSQWGRLKVGSIELADGTTFGSSGSSGNTTFGAWILGANNLNSSNGKVKIGTNGNITIDGAMHSLDGYKTALGADNLIAGWIIKSDKLVSPSNKIKIFNDGTTIFSSITTSTSDTSTIGAWNIGGSNINSSNNKIKIGNTGNIVITGSLTQGSNRNLKKNINPFEKSGLDIVESAQIREFNYLDDVDGVDMPRIGLIVDEAPLEVLDINDGGYGVLVNEAVWINWKATQELSKELANEKAKNEVLTDELADLRSEIEYIKALINK